MRLPVRQAILDDDAEDVKALSREQLATALMLAPARHRTLLELLAATGLRVSEALALERRHLALDGARPHVRVRRALVKGRVEPPKSRHGRRDVPLSRALVNRLRADLADLPDVPEALVFVTRNGTPLDADNLRRRVVKPLMEEAGAPWAGFHTLRHTYASLQLARGVNVVQVSRALGHHSAAFTLDTYVHLLEGEKPQRSISPTRSTRAPAEQPTPPKATARRSPTKPPIWRVPPAEADRSRPHDRALSRLRAARCGNVRPRSHRRIQKRRSAPSAVTGPSQPP